MYKTFYFKFIHMKRICDLQQFRTAALQGQTTSIYDAIGHI